MNPKLFHIYGPLYINSYGLFIVLGLILVLIISRKHPTRKELLSDDQFISLIMYCIFGGILGGRLLYLMTSWHDIEYPLQTLEFWNGGGSVLGVIIGILCVLPIYARNINVPILAILDFAALYAPLLQSISRIGCFFAGCCFGKEATNVLSVMYTHPDSIAPRFISLHPAQLYSSLVLLFIFLMLYSIKSYLTKPGQVISLYLLLASSERFFVDFLRGDQQFFLNTISPGFSINVLSINQWIALVLFSLAGIAFFHLSFFKRAHESF